jgi:hypothetical protein
MGLQRAALCKEYAAQMPRRRAHPFIFPYFSYSRTSQLEKLHFPPFHSEGKVSFCSFSFALSPRPPSALYVSCLLTLRAKSACLFVVRFFPRFESKLRRPLIAAASLFINLCMNGKTFSLDAAEIETLASHSPFHLPRDAPATECKNTVRELAMSTIIDTKRRKEVDFSSIGYSH